MARAHTIWLVYRHNWMQPIGCFTVKHECKTWIKKQHRWETDLYVEKAPDGGGTDEFTMTTAEFCS